MSIYSDNFNKESFVHFRHLLIDEDYSKNELENILKARPQYEVPLFQMLVVDFVTQQDDRHRSNFAVKIRGNEETFYPLYDNSNSLFFQDSESLVKEKCTDPVFYVNSFGPIGTQWDMIEDMLKSNPSLIHTVNLEISNAEIEEILNQAHITGCRYDGAKEWIRKSIDLVKALALELNKSTKPLDEHIHNANTIKNTSSINCKTNNIDINDLQYS